MPTTFVNTPASDAIVRVPSLGLEQRTAVGFVAGIAFVCAGTFFEWMLLTRNMQEEFPAWVFHGLFGVAIGFGALAALWSVVEVFRRFEFRADANRFERATIVGPLRFRREWSRSHIADTVLRHSEVFSVGKGPLAQLFLVRADGRSTLIVPPRAAAAVARFNVQIRGLLFADRPQPTADDMPAGGGLAVCESAGEVRITAAPIAPAMVSKLYHTAGAFMYGDPPFSALMAVAFAKHVRNDSIEVMFWFVLIAQMLFLSIAGYGVRRWIRGIAERRYEIVLEPARVSVTMTRDEKIASHECPVEEIGEVRSTDVVSHGEGTQRQPDIVRLEVVTTAGKVIELLYGRPFEETRWVLNRVRSFVEAQRAG